MKKVKGNEFEKEEKENNHAQQNENGLTPEKLRTYKGFEKVSETEAENIIYSIKEFSIVLYQYYLTHKQVI